MATHDYIISNASGAAVRSDLNNALAAIVSNNSNATEPATTYAYQWWADTTAGQLKLRNAANDGWVTIQELDGTMLMEDGTVGAPGLAFASDLDTGFYRGADNELGIATGGTNAIYIDDAQNVGIGNTSPSTALDVAGAISLGAVALPSAGTARIFSRDTDSNLYIQTGSGNSLSLLDGSQNTMAFFGSSVVTLQTGNTERARIDSDGRLLVGLSAGRNNWYGVSSYTPQIQNEGTDISASMISNTVNSNSNSGPYLIFGKTRGTTVGSNTAVQSSDTLGSIDFQGADGTNFQNAARIRCQVDGTPGSADMPGRLIFETTADGASSTTERMRIHNGGQVTIGTTTVNGSGGLTISAGGVIVSPPTYSTTVGGTNRDLRVDNAGLIGYVSSNRASKKNIENLPDANWIYDLNPVSFNYRRKDEDGNYTDETYSELEYGLIAEEVEPIASDLCFYDELETGRELRGVHYLKLMAPLLKAVQDLKAENEALQDRVTALEGN